MSLDRSALETARDATRERLLQLRGESGHWSGQLSASALSTATASFALHRVGGHESLVRTGLQWVADHQNDDGGWGDTVKSKSNISTTALCWAVLGISDAFDNGFTESVGGLVIDEFASATPATSGVRTLGSSSLLIGPLTVSTTETS